MSERIILSDNDILSMDEETGNIVVSADKLLGNDINDHVYISYVEDSDNISHEYVVRDFDVDNGVVLLDWIQQLEESILTEAPLSKFLQRSMKKTDAANNKDTKRAERTIKKLLARDLGPEARNWKFYFATADGKYSKAVDYNTARTKYADMGDNLIPEVANAIVTTDTGFIVRRGLEDLYRKGIRLTKETSIIPDKYKQPWTTDTFSPEEDSSTDRTNEVQPDMTDSSQTGETATQESQPTVDSQETSSENQTSKGGRYDLGISSNTYGHFLKLLYVMRPKLFDAFDKPVDVSDIKTLGDKVKYNNLADFEIEIDGKRIPAINWIKAAVKNKVLMEKVLTEAPMLQLDDSDLLNPDSINFKDKLGKAAEVERAKQIETAKRKKEEILKETNKNVPQKLSDSINRKNTTEETLELLFDDLVPSSGPADSVAGELVRAIMRILYRDANDGDMFFEGYGLETCGGSAEYLFDHGFEEDIQNILDDVYRLADDDEKYTDAVTLIAEHVITRIHEDNSLLWTVNEDDSRDYSYDYIEENQPRYEFELYGSDDVSTLVEKGVLDSWDLNRYVEEQISYDNVYEGAKVSRPWGYHDTSVTVENLTRDGYEHLKDAFNHDTDGWWTDLVSEHADELNDSDYDDDYDEDGSYEL